MQGSWARVTKFPLSGKAVSQALGHPRMLIHRTQMPRQRLRKGLIRYSSYLIVADENIS
jgi:hypothetical protein